MPKVQRAIGLATQVRVRREMKRDPLRIMWVESALKKMAIPGTRAGVPPAPFNQDGAPAQRVAATAAPNRQPSPLAPS